MAAVGQARKKTEGGSAGRLAAGRRPSRGAGRDVEKPPKASAGKGGLRGKAKKAKGSAGASSPLRGRSGPVARGFKLVVLLGLMALVGFAGVLIIDVGASLIGRARFGDITVADLVDKVKDRVFDRDVPEPKKKPAPKAEKEKTEASKPAKKTPTSTLPPGAQPAPSPEDYAKHVAPTRDPEVDKAKERLDALLKKL